MDLKSPGTRQICFELISFFIGRQSSSDSCPRGPVLPSKEKDNRRKIRMNVINSEEIIVSLLHLMYKLYI